ncbi:MAG: hypothetical protein WBE11_18625 [Candidatus Aminicenantaceae bacterium]
MIAVVVGFEFLPFLPGTDQLGTEFVLIGCVLFAPVSGDIANTFRYTKINDLFRVTLITCIGTFEKFPVLIIDFYICSDFWDSA